MGEFICVCAIYVCEIKAVEVPMCNMAQQGLPHPPPSQKGWGVGAELFRMGGFGRHQH